MITTWAGTGEVGAAPDAGALDGSPLHGPRTLVVADERTVYLTLREGNAVYRIDTVTRHIERVAGTGEPGFAGDSGSAIRATFGGTPIGQAPSGPKGLALGARELFIADTESHAIRSVDLTTGTITTIMGTGELGDGWPDAEPRRYRLNRPHSVLFSAGSLYVSDSENHRILRLVQDDVG